MELKDRHGETLHETAQFDSRREMYRLAGRTFRYPVYVTIETLWVLIVIYCLTSDLIFPDRGTLSLILLIVLGALSIVHSMRMTMTMPWLLLKSILLGGLVFGAAYVTAHFTGAPLNPALIGMVVASGHYFWSSESWTRQRAREAMARLSGSIG
jgi:hypothetical protein